MILLCIFLSDLWPILIIFYYDKICLQTVFAVYGLIFLQEAAS